MRPFLIASLLLTGSSLAARVPQDGGFGAVTQASPSSAGEAMILARAAAARGDQAEALSRYLRVLASEPNNLEALKGAGRASLQVGDLNAATAFFARAEAQAPNDGAVKAGIAATLVQGGKAAEALRYFRTAQTLGVPEATIAADRGLAYDLRGDPKRAQLEYQVALAGGRNDAVTRRLALSQAIGGDATGALATLDPLLRKQDVPAWRTRAFVKAITGDVAGARSDARLVMTPGQAGLLDPYLTRLALMRPADQAAAVFLGRFPTAGTAPSAVATAQQGGAASRPGGPYSASPSVQARVASASPFVAAAQPSGAYGRAGGTLPVSPSIQTRAATPSPSVAASTPPRASGVAPTQTSSPAPSSPPVRIAAAAPVGVAPRAAQSMSPPPTELASRQPVGASATSAPVQNSPSARSLTDPLGTRAAPSPSAVAAVSPAVTGTAAATVPHEASSQARQGEIQAAPPVHSGGAAGNNAWSLPSGVQAEPASGGVAVASATGQSNAAPPAVASGAAIPPPGARYDAPAGSPEAASPARQTGATTEVGNVTAAPARGAQVPSQSGNMAAAPNASTIGGAATAPAPLPETQVQSAAPTELAQADAAPQLPGRPEAQPAPAPRSAMPAPAPSRAAPPEPAAPAPDPAAERARRRAEAQARAKEAAAKKAAAAKAAADKQAREEAAAQKAIERANPARHWVQVAGGANKADLGRAWDALQTKWPKQLGSRKPWTLHYRYTNRLLIGPFKTSDEAQDWVSARKAEGLSTFRVETDAGDPVERVAD